MSWRKLVFLATLVAATSSTLPVHAYNWGYSPWSGSSNWQWIARSFGYPLSRLSTPGTPLYLLNPLLYNASYVVAGGANAGRRQKQFEQYQQQANQFQQQYQYGGPYTDPEPFSYPRQRTRPFMQSPYPVDQVAYTPWVGGPDVAWNGPDPVAEDGFNVGLGQAPGVGQAPPVVPAGNPAIQADPSSLAAALPIAANFDGQTPPVAPAFPRAQDGTSLSLLSTSGAAPGSPFAGAFIELVRTKFKGNIARALSDKKARALAKTLGVIPEGSFDPDDIPLERLALIEKVLSDDKESPATRLTTVRMLLRH